MKSKIIMLVGGAGLCALASWWLIQYRGVEKVHSFQFNSSTKSQLKRDQHQKSDVNPIVEKYSSTQKEIVDKGFGAAIKNLKNRSSDDNEYHLLLLKVADIAAEGGKESVVAFLNEADISLSLNDKDIAYSRALGMLAKENPSDALDLSYRLGLGSARERAQFQIFSSWSSKDPGAAIKAITRLDFPEEKKAAAEAVVLPMLGNSTALLSMLKQGEIDPKASQVIAASLSKSWEGDLSSLLSAVQGTAAGVNTKTLVDNFAARRPLEVVNYLEANPSETLNNSAVYAITSSLTNKDPAAGIDLLSKKQEFSEKEDLISGVFANWMNKDSTSALNWLNKGNNLSTQQNDHFRTIVAGQLKMSGALDDAISWANSISDPKLKEATLNKVKPAPPKNKK